MKPPVTVTEAIFIQWGPVGIVQKVFSEKASAIPRMHQKCVKNAQKWVFFCWEKRNVPKCVRNASKMRQKCAEHLWVRTPFGRYRQNKFTHMFTIWELVMYFPNYTGTSGTQGFLAGIFVCNLGASIRYFP